MEVDIIVFEKIFWETFSIFALEIMVFINIIKYMRI